MSISHKSAVVKTGSDSDGAPAWYTSSSHGRYFKTMPFLAWTLSETALIWLNTARSALREASKRRYGSAALMSSPFCAACSAKTCCLCAWAGVIIFLSVMSSETQSPQPIRGEARFRRPFDSRRTLDALFLVRRNFYFTILMFSTKAAAPYSSTT